MRTSAGCLVALYMLLLVASPGVSADVFRGDGWLLIYGGGEVPEAPERFVALAGGSQARIVVIPTAAGFDEYDDEFQSNYFAVFRKHGAVDIRLVHTYDRTLADTVAFAAPIDEATGVWITGGRQGRLAAVYGGTKTEEALHRLLRRGGVIAGGSAGASIQGSYLVRGDVRGSLIVSGGCEKGFGFLPDTVIDQHLLERNRQFDLVDVVKRHPVLLGIGLDAEAMIVVHKGEFEVAGTGVVAIYDPELIAETGRFYFLQPGDRFDLGSRTGTRNGRPLHLIQLHDSIRLSAEELKSYVGTYRTRDGKRIRVTSDGCRLAIQAEDVFTLLTPVSAELFHGEDGWMQAEFDLFDGVAREVRWTTFRTAVVATRVDEKIDPHE